MSEKEKAMRKPMHDSPEQIQKCLNCKKSRCINCVALPKESVEGKHKGKAVVAFGNGEERHFDSIREAASAFIVTRNAIQQALRFGNKCQGYYWRYADESNT